MLSRTGYTDSTSSQVATAAIGNAVQNLVTLHYTRRIYNGTFVPNPALSRPGASAPVASKHSNPEDRVDKLAPASATGKDVEKARDQVTPLAARIFGVWTIMAGVIRLYAAYDITNPALFQLAFFTHAIAVVHFTSEVLVFKTMRPSRELLAPMAGGLSGLVYMSLQWKHYMG